MVYLVGAGAGDNLITVKGLECVKKADVIIFDRLIGMSILNHAPADCRLIYAGKQSGNHHIPQEETNALMEELARGGKTVVRLKGGDPMVFGRGGEEAQYLAKRGIPFELVPGVSSCYSAAECAGIPVTHRNSASSFHVITGHETENRVDYTALAKVEGTLVFMMGLGAIAEISRKLIENGKDPQTPSAVISNGASKKQKCVTAKLYNISEAAKGLTSPAVIVIGGVVEERVEQFLHGGVLGGLKIISTATEAASENLKNEIQRYGGELTALSLIKIIPINFDKFKELNFKDFTYIVFTSANCVEVFFDYLTKGKTDIRKLCKIKFAAVGRRTALALEKRGIYADIVPDRADGKSLAGLLKSELRAGDGVLFPRAEKVSGAIREAVEDTGVRLVELAIYKTETNHAREEALRVAAKDADYVIIASGSAARAYSELCGSRGPKFISIGDSATEAAREAGLEIYKTASEPGADSIVKCILEDVE